MTEEEAKTKWCPFTRNGNEPGCNRSGLANDFPVEVCIGSKCMAWRKTGIIGIGPNGERTDRDLDGRTRWMDDGYCGAAGRPEI